MSLLVSMTYYIMGNYKLYLLSRGQYCHMGGIVTWACLGFSGKEVLPVLSSRSVISDHLHGSRA